MQHRSTVVKRGLRGSRRFRAEEAQRFAVFDRRWAPHLLAMLAEGPARFSELAEGVPGLSIKMMSERLRQLQEAGLVERRVDPGPPLATSYALTADGEELRPVLEAMLAWVRSAKPDRVAS